MPEELYYMDYREYLSIHPEITNLPDDIKHYRFNLLEKLRQKTIGMIKTKRKELIEEQENEKELSEGGGTGEKFTQKFNKSEADYKSGNKTFSEKMNKLITREKLNIKKIKEKQKQNIEFMIESQMKAELLNYKNMEKDRKLKENKEKKKKEWTEKNLKNQRIQEDMKQKRLINIETMMKKREDKITTKNERN